MSGARIIDRQKNRISAIIAIGILISFFIVSFSFNTSNNPSPEKMRISYALHATIAITGDAGFTGPNATTGVTHGSGTQADPYVIEGWEISSTSANYEISITNSAVHFIVKDCYLHGAKRNDIQLDTVTNGSIRNNVCTLAKGDGIHLVTSNHNTIVDNNCSSNIWDGIYLDQSSNNTIDRNNCSSMTHYGIYMDHSSSNIISNNSYFSNGQDGIYLYISGDNSLNYNNCSLNGRSGIYIDSCTSNTVFKNAIMNNVAYGVNVWASSQCRLWNNTIYHNRGSGDTYNAGTIQAYQGGVGVNWWNSSGAPNGYGNYWSDWNTPDLSPPFGIVDLPYNLSGTAGAKDYYPLTNAPIIPEPSIIILAPLMLIAFILIGRRMKE